jgi:anaerobic magnesium-protoporphyrin IX monomethyl ester cyclase
MSQLLHAVRELDAGILAFIDKGIAWQDADEFNRLALRAFELQFNYIPVYRGYCERRGRTPAGVVSWEDIPALFTDAFKEADLSLFPEAADRTFMTSGTISPGERGRVCYDEAGLKLMDATIRTGASAMLFPDGIKTEVLVIAPPPDRAPHMVMSYGMDRLQQYFGLPRSGFFIGENGLDLPAFTAELSRCQAEGIAVAVCGGTSGLVNFFSYCHDRGLRWHLPAGSRCLDAGGLKTGGRQPGRKAFLAGCENVLGIQDNFCVNLLGMTETASQFYDNTLLAPHGPAAKISPAWTRTLAVDPDTLEPLPRGETGLLRHFDLANRGHICAIQTDDLGRIVDGGFEILGRARDDSTRGCSLTIDEMTRHMGSC